MWGEASPLPFFAGGSREKVWCIVNITALEMGNQMRLTERRIRQIIGEELQQEGVLDTLGAIRSRARRAIGGLGLGSAHALIEATPFIDALRSGRVLSLEERRRLSMAIRELGRVANLLETVVHFKEEGDEEQARRAETDYMREAGRLAKLLDLVRFRHGTEVDRKGVRYGRQDVVTWRTAGMGDWSSLEVLLFAGTEESNIEHMRALAEILAKRI